MAPLMWRAADNMLVELTEINFDDFMQLPRVQGVPVYYCLWPQPDRGELELTEDMIVNV